MNHSRRLFGTHSTSLQNLLDRLDHVTRCKDGYRAKCPAHDGTSGDSLSVAEGGSGKVLVKCWAGCDPLSVLQAVGLEFSDLFPERITPDMSPEQQRKVRAEINERIRLSNLKAAASVLELEANVIGVFGRKLQLVCKQWGRLIQNDFAEGDFERFNQAQESISRIRDDLNGL